MPRDTPSSGLRVLSILVSLGVVGSSSSPVGIDPGWMCFLLPCVAICAVWSVIDLAIAVRRPQSRVRTAILKRAWCGVLPIAAVVLAAELVPARVRFWIARPALERFVQKSGTAVLNSSGSRIGGYPVSTIERSGPIIRMRLELSVMSFLGMDMAELVYSPGSPPTRESIQDRVYSVEHLGGDWYSLWIKF